MTPPEKRAEAFLTHAKAVVEGMSKPFFEAKPQLWAAIVGKGAKALGDDDKRSRWRYYNLIAMTWWAVDGAKFAMPDEQFEAVTAVLERQLLDWDATALDGLRELYKFIHGYDAAIDKLTDPEDNLGFLKQLIGTWVVWNLTGRAPLADEAGVAAVLGRVVHGCAAGYWADEG
ncbi:hypothetical protein EPO15_05750 [bacterium]|nr:MAG: hypothetical protein EPO15_05750 [bacterium]